MKRLKNILAAILLSTAVLSVPVTIVGCARFGIQRETHTTIHSVATAVDLAERTYLDLIVTRKIGTNDFPRIQAGYNEFQRMLRLSLDVAMGDTNAPPPAGLLANGQLFISDVRKAKEYK